MAVDLRGLGIAAGSFLAGWSLHALHADTELRKIVATLQTQHASRRAGLQQERALNAKLQRYNVELQQRLDAQRRLRGRHHIRRLERLGARPASLVTSLR